MTSKHLFASFECCQKYTGTYIQAVIYHLRVDLQEIFT